MNHPFLTAQVPYGNNGYTILLSNLEPFRRQLAEKVLDSVPATGAGVKDSMIYVCREVSQKDTGRQGAASLIITNIDVNSLGPERCQNLQHKLDLLIDSLEDLWKASPQTDARYCGPVQSHELQLWETDLKLHQEIAASQHPYAPKKPTLTHILSAKSLATATLLILVLSACLLWLQPTTAPNTQPQQSNNQSQPQPTKKQTVQSPQTPRPQIPPPQPSIIKLLDDRWNAARSEKNARLAVLTAGEIVQKQNQLSATDKHLITNWLNTRFLPQSFTTQTTNTQTPPLSMQTQWITLTTHLDGLANAASERKVKILEQRVSENVIADPLLLLFRNLLDSLWLQNVQQLYHTENKLFFTERIQLNIAAQNTTNPDTHGAWHAIDTGIAINAINKLANYLTDKPQLKESAEHLKLLLTELDKLRTSRVVFHFSPVTDNDDQRFNRSAANRTEIEFNLIDALHADNLHATNINGTNYQLQKCREYLRPLLTDYPESDIPSKNTPKFTADRKHSPDLRIELNPSKPLNKAWFEHKKLTLQLLNDTEQSLNKLRSSHKTEIHKTSPKTKGTDHAMP